MRRLLIPVLATIAAACAGPQRVLDPRGPDAAHIAELWWVFLALATLTSIAIPALLLLAIHRARQRHAGRAVPAIDGARLVWIGGAAVPLIMLLAVLVASYRSSTALTARGVGTADPLTIDIIGHQFWWEVRYPAHDVLTANEFRIPIDTDVRLRLTASDVIHSFWVPQLTGKIDLIPGRTHTWWLRADSVGWFRGQCAEYCGMSHALMAFRLQAVSRAEFDDWLARRAAPDPAIDPAAQRGRAVFVRAGCQYCHGTPQQRLPRELGSPGPDLSDFGARTTLAAARLPNTRETLAAWISAPQQLKPGSRMPATALSGEDMAALIGYLYSLR